MNPFLDRRVRCGLLLLALSGSAQALDYTFYLDGQRVPFNTVEQDGKVFVEANKFGRYLGPILDRVIDVNSIVGAITGKVDLGPLSGLFGGLVNRAANDAKYEVIRRAEEPFVEIGAFAKGQGAQLVFHPFDRTFVLGRDAASLQRGEDVRFAALGPVQVRLDEAHLDAGRLSLRFVTRDESEAHVRGWTFVADGTVLEGDVRVSGAGRVNVTLDLEDGSIPAELDVHGPNGSRVRYDLSSLH